MTMINVKIISLVWLFIKVKSNFGFTNLVLNKPSYQLTTYETRYAKFANDGDNITIATTNSIVNGDCWWYVDLMQQYEIRSIQIINTVNGPDFTYLQYIFATITNESYTTYNESLIWSSNNQSIGKGELLILNKESTSKVSSVGQYITIWKFNKGNIFNALTLAEVFVEGDIPPTPSTTTVLTIATATLTTTTTTDRNTPTPNTITTTTIDTASLTATTTTDFAQNFPPNFTTSPLKSIINGDISSDRNLPIIVGASVGAVCFAALIVLIVLCVFCCLRKKRRKNDGELEGHHIVLEPVASILLDGVESYIIENKTNIISQFESLPNDKIKKTSIGVKHNDVPRNRYKNILPFDDNLVPLQIEQGDETDETYINASFIEGYGNQDRRYIACQGPIKETIKDMWRMIWQYKINNIVMLTQIVENAKIKSEKYWPENMNEDETFDKINVVLLHENFYTHYVHRIFAVEKLNQVSEERLEVNHFQFMSWMDKSRPDDCFSLFSFQKLVQKMRSNSNSPVLVHCSAGVGRTGSYIAIENLLEEARNEKKVSVYQCVNNLRLQRMHMVQTQTQYDFVYDAMVEFAKYGDSYIPVESFVDEYKKTSKMNHDITKQYAMLDSLRNKDKKSIGKTPANKSKNRRSDIYASDDCRLHLSNTHGKEVYINAVFNDSYNMSRGFILTQTPMTSTVEDYWTMVAEYGGEIVVLLEDFNGEDENSPIFWPSNVGQSIQFGVHRITLTSAVLEQNLVVYNLELEKENGLYKKIIMYKIAKKKKVPTATLR